jgi:hypothetical protein
MRTKLSSDALVGINAVPVDVIVKGDQVNVVATRSGVRSTPSSYQHPPQERPQ